MWKSITQWYLFCEDFHFCFELKYNLKSHYVDKTNSKYFNKSFVVAVKLFIIYTNKIVHNGTHKH